MISEPCKNALLWLSEPCKKRPDMAKRVVKAQIDKRVGSRHRLYPCCGKRRAYCKCDWGWYRRNIKAKEQNKFWGIIPSAELLRGTDTADMGYFLEEVACPLLVDAPLAMFLKACLVFRRFSRVDTWKIIQEEILKPKTDLGEGEQGIAEESRTQRAAVRRYLLPNSVEGLPHRRFGPLDSRQEGCRHG